MGHVDLKTNVLLAARLAIQTTKEDIMHVPLFLQLNFLLNLMIFCSSRRRNSHIFLPLVISDPNLQSQQTHYFDRIAQLRLHSFDLSETGGLN